MQKHIKSFINESSVGLIATCDHQKPHAVPVYYLLIEAENAFYFMTKTASNSYLNLKNNGRASITIFSEKPPTVYTANCESEILEFSVEEYSGIRKKLIAMHATEDYYPSPVSTLRKGELKLVKLNILDSNYQSYSHADANE